jgi:hypothetical protein
MLVGNKADLVDERAVSKEEVHDCVVTSYTYYFHNGALHCSAHGTPTPTICYRTARTACRAHHCMQHRVPSATPSSHSPVITPRVQGIALADEWGHTGFIECV